MLIVDLTPADMQIDVLEGEPSSIVFPVAVNGVEVDVSVEFPNLVSRTKVSDTEVVESPVLVQNINEVVAVIPALEYNKSFKVYWELRDLDADKTWIQARVKVEEDKV
jgi:hypothetical protein